jgi:hypothetical protein
MTVMISHWKFLLGIGLFLPAMVGADIRHDLDDPALAAMVNGEAISRQVIVGMHAVAVKRRPETTLPEVMISMIEDRLLADNARAHYPMEKLIETTRVGYAPAIQMDESLVANLQAAYGREIMAAVRAEKGGSLNGIVTKRPPVTTADWDAVLGKNPGLMLVYALDEKGRKAAANTMLLLYQSGEKTGKVTLLDVYDAQHVQGRARLHGRDAGFALQQAELLLEREYVKNWAKTRSGLGEEGFKVFERAVRDRLVKDGWTSLIGVTADMHDDNPHLKALAAAVTPEEIAVFYEKNKDQFKRIERVRAWHIRTADFEAANKVYGRLQKGEAFVTVARDMSIAEDHIKGGELGWIVHGDKNATWIESVAFVQKPGTTSRPFRSPGPPGTAAVWEILKVDERIEGYQPKDSESVRYGASQALARQKALAEFRDTRERLLKSADIRINPSVIRLSKGALP